MKRNENRIRQSSVETVIRLPGCVWAVQTLGLASPHANIGSKKGLPFLVLPETLDRTNYICLELSSNSIQTLTIA